MPLTTQDLIANGLLDELAGAFNTWDMADSLLWSVAFPPGNFQLDWTTIGFAEYRITDDIRRLICLEIKCHDAVAVHVNRNIQGQLGARSIEALGNRRQPVR